MRGLPIDDNFEDVFVRQLPEVPLPEAPPPLEVPPPEELLERPPSNSENSEDVERVMGMQFSPAWLMRSEHIENLMEDVHVGVPMVVFEPRTEEEQIEDLLRDLIAENELRGPVHEQDDAEDLHPPVTNSPVRWPTQDEDPVNEYTTEGYIAMAFPALLPFGGADLRDQSKRKVGKVDTAEYFDTLLRYKDGRFGSHPR